VTGIHAKVGLSTGDLEEAYVKRPQWAGRRDACPCFARKTRRRLGLCDCPRHAS